MAGWASPLQILAIAGVIIWPLAGGLAVVFWSRARAAAHARKLAGLETGLRGLYQEIESDLPPARLNRVVDALEEADALKPAPHKRRSNAANTSRP